MCLGQGQKCKEEIKQYEFGLPLKFNLVLIIRMRSSVSPFLSFNLEKIQSLPLPPYLVRLYIPYFSCFCLLFLYFRFVIPWSSTFITSIDKRHGFTTTRVACSCHQSNEFCLSLPRILFTSRSVANNRAYFNWHFVSFRHWLTVSHWIHWVIE